MSEEIKIIDDKLTKIQAEHANLTKKKREMIQQLKQIDEQIIQKVGAYQSLMEVKHELTVEDKTALEEVVEEKACPCEDCDCEEAKEVEKAEGEV